MEPRLFNLDPQLLHDAVLLAIAVFVMFLFLSYMLFNPAREMLKKRQDKVKDEIDSAEKSKEDAAKLKEEYENRLREIHKEEDAILGAARKRRSTMRQRSLRTRRQRRQISSRVQTSRRSWR